MRKKTLNLLQLEFVYLPDRNEGAGWLIDSSVH